MVGVAQSSKPTSHIQHAHFPHFDTLSLSLLTVFPQSGNVKIFSEKQGVRQKKRGFGGEVAPGSVTPHRLPVLADLSGRPERLTGTELHPVQCDMTLSPLSLPSLMCRWCVAGSQCIFSPPFDLSHTQCNNTTHSYA